MKKKNGFTMVELLVSLVLITTLSIALFKVVANIQKKEQINIARNSLTAFKAVLNNNIETDFINDTITELYSCGDNCFDITYKNKGKVRLNLEDNIITYGSMKEELPKNYKLYSNISITFYESDEENKNAYVLLTITIKGDLEKGFENIKYMYLYNSKENPINDNSLKVTLDYNDGSNKKTYIKVLNGSSYGSLPQLSKNRFEFLGWYSEKVGGILVNKDTTVLKNYDHIVFHTDASQAIGKINIDIQNADLVTIAPHKFYGLMGISILVKRKNIELKPQILGGKSTTVYRSGTPNTNLIASTAVAIEKAYKNLDERYKYVMELHDYLINLLKQNKDVIINSTANSFPYTIPIPVQPELNTSYSVYSWKIFYFSFH